MGDMIDRDAVLNIIAGEGLHILDKAICALPAASAEDVRAGADVAEDEDDKYLILKRGMYYRPNRRGYTSSPAEAGRYTLAQAVFISHPNGPDGPRDGMSFVPVAALTETPADGGSNG